MAGAGRAVCNVLSGNEHTACLWGHDLPTYGCLSGQPRCQGFNILTVRGDSQHGDAASSGEGERYRGGLRQNRKRVQRQRGRRVMHERHATMFLVGCWMGVNTEHP